MRDANFLNMKKQALAFRRLITQNHLVVIGTTWLLVQTICYYRFGIVTNFEATKYIEQADYLLANGSYTTGNFLFYSTQILLIAGSKLIGSFPWIIVLVQLAVNACATAAFYRLCLLLIANKFTAVCTTLIFTSLFYYQLYNVHLFTESLFFSFSILYTYLLFSIKKIQLKTVGALVGALVLLYFTRPMGLFFVPATGIYIILKFFPKKAGVFLLSFLAVGLLLLYALLNFALRSGGEYDFLLPYTYEHIICGVAGVAVPNKITPIIHQNSIEGLWYVVTNHANLFLKLAAKRLLFFFCAVRPYYGWAHNVFIALYFWSMYVFMIKNVKNLWRQHLAKTVFMLTYIFFVALTVALSCDEWHNRFLLGIFPFLLLLAAAGPRKATT